LTFGRPHYEYQALAAQNGLRVIALQVQAEAWHFKPRNAFMEFCLATYVEWTRLLPEDKRQAFITELLDRYRTVAADNPPEKNTFNFYQLEVVLAPKGEAGMGLRTSVAVCRRKTDVQPSMAWTAHRPSSIMVLVFGEIPLGQAL
jgi:hypothetical protein